jgi:lipopolysaccharide/colanic/teichoic acid biosynthesis glycosyltransferase
MISRDDTELLTPPFASGTTAVSVPHYLFANQTPAHNPFYDFFKRALDFVASLALLVLLFPLFLVIALLIVAKDGMPVLFRHQRVGREGKPFQVLKFRTMRNDAEQLLTENPELMKEFAQSFKLEKDPRVTKLGRWLRSCSLDELPQLINVLKGEMSLVGPRPIVEAELEKYGLYADVYLSLKPGCAGLWQCSGRSDTSYDERVHIDVEYAMKASIKYDLSVFFWTIIAIIRRQGAR